MPQYVEVHDLEKIVRGLVDRIHTLETKESKPQAWQSITFNTGWLWYAEPWSGGYWKDPFGVVHLAGLVTTNSVTPGSPIFTLPVGYRPAKNNLFPALMYSPGYALTRLDVYPDGTVIHTSAVLGATWTPSATPNVTWIGLYGITFRV